jgi:predicted DNA-binding transcriptional regulator YafY
MISMGSVFAFSAPLDHAKPVIRSPAERVEGAWRVYPMEGALELHYFDRAGNPSRRRILARELKVGPGKTLLGGIDMADDGYRGFRADRIERIVDAETGLVIDRNILDWLLKRAEEQARERRKARRSKGALAG